MNGDFLPPKLSDLTSVDRVHDLLEGLIKALVDYPDHVSVSKVKIEKGYKFIVSVSAGDRGKVIGRGGRTARSLRTILSAIGEKMRQSFPLDIDSPDGAHE